MNTKQLCSKWQRTLAENWNRKRYIKCNLENRFKIGIREFFIRRWEFVDNFLLGKMEKLPQKTYCLFSVDCSTSVDCYFCSVRNEIRKIPNYTILNELTLLLLPMFFGRNGIDIILIVETLDFHRQWLVTLVLVLVMLMLFADFASHFN